MKGKIIILLTILILLGIFTCVVFFAEANQDFSVPQKISLVLLISVFAFSGFFKMINGENSNKDSKIKDNV